MPRRRVREQESLLPRNLLYCGDNLEVLRLYQDDKSVDLIYLDPPFKKHANYNVLFKELSGRKAAAQVKAFASTWTWDSEAIDTYHAIIEKGGRLSEAMQAFRKMLGDSEMLAYLTMMAPRLVELHRVMKPSASIYLHCDPANGHYLKVLMDAVFGPKHFQNEIVWGYRGGGVSKRRFGRKHDTLFFYTKGKAHYFKPQYTPYSESTVAVTGRTGRRVNKTLIDLERGGHMPDWWTDFNSLQTWSPERVGYPTQKPKPLLERIIDASCPPGGVVLDPFCGCGTTVVVAEEMRRSWIGIDITYKAIEVIRDRFERDGIEADYTVKYEPVSVDDAQRLASEKDKSKFEEWAVRRVGGVHSGRRGADQGIDGRIYFHDEPDADTKLILISVKAGATGPRHVRELDSVMRRDQADIGVLVSMREPTIQMRREARNLGTYTSVYWGERYPTLQLLTVKQLLEGQTVQYPRGDRVPAMWRLEQPAEGEQAPSEPQVSPPRERP